MQIAKAVGTYVVAVTGSDKKLRVAKEFKADEFINYNKIEN